VPDQPNTDRFKSEMPRIPGVSGGPPRRAPSNKPNLPMIGAVVTALLFVVVAGHFAMRPKQLDPAPPTPTPQLEVATPAPDPAAALPHASEAQPTITTITEMAQPWSHQEFFLEDRLTGENLPSLLVRLPTGSASQPASYWAFVMRTAYGSCHLEYITDLDKLRTEYGFHGAKHPMIGDPCSRTIFDPEKMTMLPGNIWVRGAIVQGSDVRPPLGIQVQIKGQNILAVRHE
jgi:hypothetical protein